MCVMSIFKGNLSRPMSIENPRVGEKVPPSWEHLKTMQQEQRIQQRVCAHSRNFLRRRLSLKTNGRYDGVHFPPEYEFSIVSSSAGLTRGMNFSAFSLGINMLSLRKSLYKSLFQYCYVDAVVFYCSVRAVNRRISIVNSLEFSRQLISYLL